MRKHSEKQQKYTERKARERQWQKQHADRNRANKREREIIEEPEIPAPSFMDDWG